MQPSRSLKFQLFASIGIGMLAAQSVVAQEQNLPFDVFGEAVSNQQIYRYIESQGEELVAAQPEDAVETLYESLDSAASTCQLRIESLTSSSSVEKDELYQHMVKSSLYVGELYDCGRCDRTHAGFSGGVLISEDGLALTNYHVLDRNEARLTEGYMAMTYDGRCFEIQEILAANKDADIALIRLKADGFKFYAAPLASVRPNPVESIRIVSNPKGEFFVTTQGEVSRYAKVRKQTWMEVTAEFGGGSSGSGVFNDRGEVVGIVSRIKPLIRDSKSTNRGGDKNSKGSFVEMILRRCVPLSEIQACFAKE